MQMDDGGHMHHDMGGMAGMAAPPPIANRTTDGGMMMQHSQMMMHMTFFWGKNAEILFSGWPGQDNLGMYVLALIVVFALAIIVEWFSHCNFIKESTNHVVAGMVQTLMYGIRIGLAYMVMLAVMSFNAGVFLVAIAGHMVGFFFFGSRVFKKSTPSSWKTSDLPPPSC